MIPIRHSHTRSGFLLLMLIAFASILLGLATTFYYYTSRGMDDSQTAVRLAQQRLALAGALNYVTSKVLPAPAIPIPAGTFYPSSGDGNAVQLSISSVPRTLRMGWFRVALANTAYTTTNYPPSNSLGSDSVYITAGTGPSGGKMSPTNGNDWQFELRSWYLARLSVVAGKYTIVSLTPVFPPPVDAGTPLW